MVSDALRARIGRRLEAGTDGSPLTRILASGWAAWSARFVARPLRIPDGVSVIGIGGAVLGGAGKTPVAIALTRAFAARGDRAALVGHAYRARPGEPRLVGPDAPVSLVGDDALAAARLLHGTAAVFVAPDRQAAIDHAAALGHRLVLVDGLLQTAPSRLAAAILVVDARAPWGSGACPPLGDLRAPRSSLLAATDVVAVLRQTAFADLTPCPLSLPRPVPSCERLAEGAEAERGGEKRRPPLPPLSGPAPLDNLIDVHGPGQGEGGGGVRSAGTLADLGAADCAVSLPSHIAGALSPSGETLSLSDLIPLRLGLLLTIARPERIVSALALAGIHPLCTLQLGDHAVPTPAVLARAARLGQASRLDAWLTTARCATKLPGRVAADQPILTLDHRVDVSSLLAALLPRLAWC